MKSLGLVFINICFYSYCFCQLQPYNKAYIWRGFQHQWTYNHRCIRLGDYVQYNAGTPISVHASATGIGADSSFFTSFYTYVATPDVVFKEGEVSFKLKAKEKQLIEKSVSVSVPAEEWMRGKTDYITLINGFDLRSDRAADKIQLMRFSVEDGEYDSIKKQINFIVNVSLVLNCQSIECNELSNKVIYDLSVYYLIVGLNKGQAAATAQFFTKTKTWDRKEEMFQEPEEKVIVGDAFPTFPNATIGVKAFSFVLNEAHWLVQMNNDVVPLSYDSTTAGLRFSMDMVFKEWHEGMKGSYAAPIKSKFSEKRKGWSVMDMDLVLLQFKKASIKYGQKTGNNFWRGSFGTANGNNPKEIYDIPVE